MFDQVILSCCFQESLIIKDGALIDISVMDLYDGCPQFKKTNKQGWKPKNMVFCKPDSTSYLIK